MSLMGADKDDTLEQWESMILECDTNLDGKIQDDEWFTYWEQMVSSCSAHAQLMHKLNR